MCFYVDNDKCPLALVATKDIVCWKGSDDYKITDVGFSSSIQNFPYKWNNIYGPIESFGKNRFDEVNEGYHSYRKLEFAAEWHDENSIRCYIPEGSLYFFNDEEYVSDRIVVMGKEYVNKRESIP